MLLKAATHLEDALPFWRSMLAFKIRSLIGFEFIRFVVQAKQQGGTLVFDGQKTLWRYNDPATSAHARPDQILKEGLKGL